MVTGLTTGWAGPCAASARRSSPPPTGIPKCWGDGFLATFDRQARAVLCAGATHQEALMNTKLKFTFEKETKGAVRYQEVGEDGAPAFAPQVGTLYVRKSAMPGGKIPKTLIVTIASE
jgi:hypothetical protein